MNNEMDELFRKAGEDYPLNLGKPDWDAVAGKLHTDTGDLGPGFGLAAAAPRKRRRYLWLLLLLLPAGLYGIIASRGSASTQGAEAKENSASVSRGAADPETPGTRQDVADGRKSGQAAVLPSGSVAAPVAGAGAETSNTATALVEPAKQQEGQHSPAVRNGNEPKARQKTPINGNKSSGSGVSGFSRVSGNGNIAQDPGTADRGGTDNRIAPGGEPGRKNPTAESAQTRDETPFVSSSDRNAKAVTASDGDVNASVAPDIAAANKASAAGIVGDSSSTLTDQATGSPLADLVMADKAKNKDSEARKNNTSGSPHDSAAANKNPGSKKPVIHPSVKQNRGFYAGITAAPDFSTVKFQTMKSTGYSFGVVGGYRFNSHLSVETGLSWDRKKYYSRGEYFDKSKTRIPSNVKVTFLDGYCDMFEIPLVLRYDITTGKKGNWFAAAGLSSYLMKNENYLYGAEANSVSWSRYVDYKNSGNNFFSIIQFSAGYEYNWSARNRIRVEPYFKAPLSGVGIGSLPISSLGMTFGFIHSFR